MKKQVAELKEKSKALEAAMEEAASKIQEILYTIPNLPNDSVPEGFGAEDNVVEREGGVKPDLGDCALPHWDLAKKYLEKVSSLFDFNAMAQNTSVTAQDTGVVDKLSRKAGIFGNEAAGDLIATLPVVVDDFIPTVERNLYLADKCHKESWRILTYHGEYCKGISRIYYALSRNDTALATKYCEELIDYLSEVELEIDLYFDLCLFAQRTKQLIAGK